MNDNFNSKECEICEKGAATRLRKVQSKEYKVYWEICESCEDNFQKITYTKPTEYAYCFEPTIEYFEWLRRKYIQQIDAILNKVGHISQLQTTMIMDRTQKYVDATTTACATITKRTRKNNSKFICID